MSATLYAFAVTCNHFIQPYRLHDALASPRGKLAQCCGRSAATVDWLRPRRWLHGLLPVFFCGSQMMFQGLEGRMIGCDAQAKLLWELQLHFSKNSCAAVQDHADGSTRRKHLTTIGQCLVAGLAGNLDHDPVGVAAAVEDCLTSLCRVSPEVLQLTSMCILSFEY